MYDCHNKKYIHKICLYLHIAKAVKTIDGLNIILFNKNVIFAIFKTKIVTFVEEDMFKMNIHLDLRELIEGRIRSKALCHGIYL